VSNQQQQKREKRCTLTPRSIGGATGDRAADPSRRRSCRPRICKSMTCRRPLLVSGSPAATCLAALHSRTTPHTHLFVGPGMIFSLSLSQQQQVQALAICITSCCHSNRVASQLCSPPNRSPAESLAAAASERARAQPDDGHPRPDARAQISLSRAAHTNPQESQLARPPARSPHPIYSRRYATFMNMIFPLLISGAEFTSTAAPMSSRLDMTPRRLWQSRI
jgi:hypothetical protein